MSTLVDQIKPELMSNHMPQQQTHHQSHGGSTAVRGSKPQACKVCGKMLSSASSYYVHMKLHSGTKPFACTVCDAAFCRKPYLEVHMRTHTGKSNFNPISLFAYHIIIIPFYSIQVNDHFSVIFV